MSKTQKNTGNSKSLKPRLVPVIDNELKKYLNDPILIKKTEQAKKMVGVQ